MLVPSNTSLGLLWVEVAKAALFRGLFHINADRVLVVEYLMGRKQLFLELLYHHAPVCLSAVLIFFFGKFWKIVFAGKSLFFYLGLASQGQNCPRHGFLDCHDHHCLFYMWLWALAWASGPIQKMDVYHWIYDPTIIINYFVFTVHNMFDLDWWIDCSIL